MLVGRLAIDAFFPSSKALEKIIGKWMEYSRAHVMPLPNPSSISLWYQNREHRALIYQAAKLIGSVDVY